MKRYCFDIDGTICTNTWGDYDRAVPNYQRINFVNSLYDAGNHVIYLLLEVWERVMVTLLKHMICGVK